jgi:hypothetical protein
MSLSTALKAFAAGAMALCAFGAAAHAGSVAEPGSTLGGAPGSPVPEGVYFGNNFSLGDDRTSPHNRLAIEIPVIAWATPYRLFGGQLLFTGSVPSLALWDDAGPTNTTIFTPKPVPIGPVPFSVKGFTDTTLAFAEGGPTLAWNLGGGWNFSQGLRVYTPGPFDGQTWFLEGRTALTYLTPGWNISANFIYGFAVSNRVDNFAGQGVGQSPQNDYAQVDFQALKKWDKWEAGIVGFAAFDTNVSGATLNLPAPGTCANGNASQYFNGFNGNTCTGKQSRIALGGLVGRDFGGVHMSVYATHDVFEENYGGKGLDGKPDTRVFTRTVIPLWVNTEGLK